MDYKIVLSVLLIAHFLGDFYFQSRQMAKEKNDSRCRILKHGVIYALCIFICAYLFFGFGAWWLPVIIAVSHLVIDMVKGRLARLDCVRKHSARRFFTDQIVHIAIIVVIAYFYAITYRIAYSSFAMEWREIYISLELGLPFNRLIPLACLFLFIWKPASIITMEILQSVRENGQEPASKAQGKAGNYIGILERSLTVIFFLLGQYTAIAFTLTAKSIARFKELENADFAEQYLIGTLVSQLLAITAAALLGYF